MCIILVKHANIDTVYRVYYTEGGREFVQSSEGFS